MGSIFDENSEFLEYLNKKKKDKESELNGDSLYFKATPFITKESKEKSVSNNIPPQPSKLQEEEEHLELHIQDESAKEVFTLNLKHKPLKAAESKKLNQSANTVQKNTPQNNISSHESNSHNVKKLAKLNKKGTTLSSFLWDKISFIATTLAIFFVFFFAMNWSAYSQILGNKYQEYTGELDESPLQSFVTSKTEVNQNLELQEVLEVSNSPFAVNHFSIPRINLEVVPPGVRIIIPRINKNVPIINVSDDKLLARDWSSLEADIQDSLKDGVVHYPGTPWPNQSGNVVLTGHSSYYPWDPGRFKDVFALLHNVQQDDEIVLFYKQKRYIYKVSDIQVVQPSEVNVLGDSGDDRLTLITCTPVGTNLKRLIVTAKPI